MTEDERERERLSYIRESIARIGEYTRGGREAFDREPMVQDAVLRRLETLADARSRPHARVPTTESGHIARLTCRRPNRQSGR